MVFQSKFFCIWIWTNILKRKKKVTSFKDLLLRNTHEFKFTRKTPNPTKNGYIQPLPPKKSNDYHSARLQNETKEKNFSEGFQLNFMHSHCSVRKYIFLTCIFSKLLYIWITRLNRNFDYHKIRECAEAKKNKPNPKPD